MFRKIEEVQIGGEAPGEAFGGFIYNLGCQIGYNGNPTTVSVNVVSENGAYNISKQDLSTIEGTSINVGSEIKFQNMYLKDYQMTSDANAKLLSLNYIDRTILFKKIFIGLIGVHGNPLSLMNTKTSRVSKDFKHVRFPVQCMPCSYADDVPPLKPVDVKFRASSGFVHNVDLKKGGAVLLGTEEFSKNLCEQRQVSYSWRELVFVLNTIGIQIQANPDTGEPSITDRGKIHERERFTGTLDEVISQWCAKFGYSWGFDPQLEKIYGIDKIYPIETLQEVKDKINNLSGSSKIVVTSTSESASLDGTMVHDHVSAVKKPFHRQTTSETDFMRTSFENIKLEDLFGTGGEGGLYGGGRTLEELMISSILAKYNTDARKLYNMQLARDKAQAKGGNLNTSSWTSSKGDNFLEPLGITCGYHLTDAEKQLYVNLIALTPATMTAINNFQAQYGVDADAFVGTYSKALEERWIEWEKEIADFIGKYYWTRKPAVDFSDCKAFWKINRQLTVEPKSDLYTTQENKRYPYYKILENHPVTAISAVGSATIDVTSNACSDTAPYDGFAPVLGGPSVHLIRGATYVVNYLGCDPKDTTLANPSPVYFKLYKNEDFTGAVAMEVIPNPGGNTKANITIPGNLTENVLYYKNAAGDAQSVSVIDDPRKQNGLEELWITEWPAAYGTDTTDIDRMFMKNGKAALKTALPQYQELVGLAASTFLPSLQQISTAAYNEAVKQSNDGFDPVIWILPEKQYMDDTFSPPTSIDEGATNTNEKIFDTSKKPGVSDNCKDACDYSLIEKHCRCTGRDWISVRPTFVGKISPKARYITFDVNNENHEIVLPVEERVLGYHIQKQDIILVHKALEYFYGQMRHGANTMGIKVTTKDITNDIDEQIIDINDVQEKIDNYSWSDNQPGIPGAGKVRKEGKIIVPDKSWAGGKTTFTAVHPYTYHQWTDQSYVISEPTEKFSCSVLGLDFEEIDSVLTPSKGLISMQINYSADGIQTDLQFSNRQLGGNEMALLKESTFHRLEPLLGLNRYGRTF
tara:strand:+ start:7035 stop:10133 length:3099 start_codon:yes stop_codon:yes gene_type:complete